MYTEFPEIAVFREVQRHGYGKATKSDNCRSALRSSTPSVLPLRAVHEPIPAMKAVCPTEVGEPSVPLLSFSARRILL